MDERNTGRKKVAVLIDAENVPLKYVDKIFTRARSEGTVCFKRIYGKVKIPKTGVNPLLEYGITHIQSYSYVPDKNTADMVMTVDAMVQLYKNDVDVFCIVSSDSDFAPLVNKIVEEGKTVIGMGESKAVKSFQNSCDEFVVLNEPVAEGNRSAKPKTEKTVKTEEEAEITEQTEDVTVEKAEVSTKKDAAVAELQTELSENTEIKVAAPTSEPTAETAEDSENKPMTAPESAEELREIIIEILSGEKAEDGWHILSRVFSKLNERFADFEPKKYGSKTPTALVEALGFGLEKRYKNKRKTGSYDAYISIPENFGKQSSPKAGTEAKQSGDTAVASNDIKRELPSIEELTENVIDIIKAKGNEEGRMAITHIIMELKDRFSDFDIKKYNLGNATSALRVLGFDTGNNYAGLGKHQPATETVPEVSATDTQTEKQTPQTAIPETEQLKRDIETILSNAEEEDGWVRFKFVSDELNKKYVFDPTNYGCHTMGELLEKMGFEITVKTKAKKKTYYVRILRDGTVSATDTESARAVDVAAATAPPAYAETVDDTNDITVTVGNRSDTDTQTDTDEEHAEADTPTDTESEQTEAKENEQEQNEEEEEAEEIYVLPVVNELPEDIDTMDQLRDTIIFILSHESVSSPTRLTAAIKYWFPDFKIKNYGCTKMPQLLEKLEIYVF